MNAICEIDKAGRIVVPKKLRDALHLVPGTRLLFRQEGQSIVVEPEAKLRGLYRKDGILVYGGGSLPPLEDRDWVQEDREARMNAILGIGIEP